MFSPTSLRGSSPQSSRVVLSSTHPSRCSSMRSRRLYIIMSGIGWRLRPPAPHAPGGPRCGSTVPWSCLASWHLLAWRKFDLEGCQNFLFCGRIQSGIPLACFVPIDLPEVQDTLKQPTSMATEQSNTQAVEEKNKPERVTKNVDKMAHIYEWDTWVGFYHTHGNSLPR